MKTRAMRYLFLYTFLLLCLAGFRYFTRDTYAEKFDLEEQQKALILRKSQLEQERLRLESTARIREWAMQHNMIPQTKAVHQFVKLLPLEKTETPKKHFSKTQVVTKWR